jgi:mono/diheme cytochrome c family protein
MDGKLDLISKLTPPCNPGGVSFRPEHSRGDVASYVSTVEDSFECVYCEFQSKENLLKTFLIGLIIGLILVPLCVYVYFVTGSAPVATAAPEMPFEKMLAHGALSAHIAKEMPKSVPVPADETNFAAGAQVYRENCAVCHGLPGGTPTAVARGMYPKPPKLLEGTGVTDDEPGETYWKVSNGIRLSGMPGFSESLSQTQMWQVSLLLAHADKLPDSVKTALYRPTLLVPEQVTPPSAPSAQPAPTAPPTKP